LRVRGYRHQGQTRNARPYETQKTALILEIRSGLVYRNKLFTPSYLSGISSCRI